MTLTYCIGCGHLGRSHDAARGCQVLDELDNVCGCRGSCPNCGCKSVSSDALTAISGEKRVLCEGCRTTWDVTP